jgi:putative Mg2+ transporter-C (MgtC) family protein
MEMELLNDQNIELTVRLLGAVVLGGSIGFERELHGKVAGFRTHSLVALGSALIMLVSTYVYELYQDVATVDPSRIAAQVVTGIGFIGAGTILRSGAGIKGLTTAAGLWTASGIGLACGLGYFRAAVIATLVTLFVLIVFSWVGRQIGARDV